MSPLPQPAGLLDAAGLVAALMGLGGLAGFHLAGVLALSPSWWRLPPDLRGRCAGSFHRFGPRPRLLLGILALVGLALRLAACGTPGPESGRLVLAAAVLCAGCLACVLPALPLERRMVALFYEAAGADRDREFIEAQAAWDRWQMARAVLSGLAFLFVVGSVLRTP